MTKYTRITGKVFGSSADPTGSVDPTIGATIGQFGSALAGTYNGTSDVATIQSLSAWQDGFIGAVTPNTQFPPLPEMTGFGKVLSYQLCYLLQQGVAEYDSGTTYYDGNWVSYNKALYIAKQDNFSNQLPTNTTYWTKFTGGSGRNLGEYVTSSLPLTDTTLHLADGSLLSQTDYPELVSHISDIYVPPTYVTYYCWEEKGFGYPYFTLSATPVVNDDVYDLVGGEWAIVGTVTQTFGSGTEIRIQVNSNIYNCDRNSAFDQTVAIFSQSFFTTEANWQSEYSTYGECGKYVYNSGANTVRIPSVNSYFTNTTNANILGDLTPASIPNIKGTVDNLVLQSSTTNFDWTGAFYNAGIGGDSLKPSNTTQVGTNEDNIGLDASRSSSIYSDTATTVNTQSIKQLVYIVVKQ